MKRILFTCLTSLFLLSVYGSAQTAVPDNDFQFWHETKVKIPVFRSKPAAGNEKGDPKLSLVLIGTFRAGQNRFAPVDERIGAGLIWNIRKGVSFTPSYIYRAAQPGRGVRSYEHRLRFDLELEKKWTSFSLKNRNRIEYRVRHSRSDSVRYRNKTTLKIPVKKDGKELFAPFVANEPYYDITAERFSSNEFSAGISKKFTKNMSADIFYLNKYNVSGSPKYVNALGVYLTFTVD